MKIFKFVFLACPNFAHVVRCNLTSIPQFIYPIIQGSRGRRIRRPGTKKIGLGRMVLLRDDSTDARFFRHEASQNSSILHWF